MLNTPRKEQANKNNSTKINELIINEIQLIDPKQRNFAYASVSTQNGSIVQNTPVFQNKMLTQWSVLIDSDQPTIRLYTYSASVGISSKKQIGAATLLQDHNIGFIYSNKNPHKKICLVKYQINQLQMKKSNHFIYEQNIFQDPQFEQPLKKINLNLENKSTNLQQISMSQNKYIKIQQPPKEQNNPSQQEGKILQLKIIEASRIVDESIKEAQEERKLYIKYLDDSNSFIKQLMGSFDEKQKAYQKIQDISAIKEEKNESEQEINTQQKWYMNKFHKDSHTNRPKRKVDRSYLIKALKKNFNQKIVIHYQKSQQQYSEDLISRQLSDIVIDHQQKIKEITIMVQKQEGSKQMINIATLTKVQPLLSNIWPTQILIKQVKPIHILCSTQKKQLIGCIGKIQQKQGQCQLFNIKGQKQGTFSFKIKLIGSSSVQTYEVIKQKKQQKKKLSKQNQLIESGVFANQVHLVDNLSQKQMKIQQKIKDQVEPKKDKQRTKQIRQESREIIKQPGRIYLNIPRLHPVQLPSENQNSIPLTSFADSKTPQYLKKLQIKQYKFNDGIEQNNNQFIYNPQTQQKVNKKYTNFLKQPNNKDQKMTYYVSPRFQEQPDNENSKKIGTAYNILQKQENQSRNNRNLHKFDDSTVRVDTLNKSFMSKNNKQLKSINKERLSTERATNITEHSYQRGRDLVNLKISNIEVKLEKPNFKQIFMKLAIDSDSTPYFTETSNQLYNLAWKNKGYFFLNLDQSSKLTIYMLESNRSQAITKGLCQISIAQLDLKQKRILQLQDVLFDQNQVSIGKLFLQYQFFQRRNNGLKSLSLVPVVQRQNNQFANTNLPKPFEINRQFKNKLKQLYKIKDIKTIQKRRKQKFINLKMKSAVNEGNQQSQKRIQLHDKVFNLLSKNYNSSKVRKYTGGNIIIPRAPRFKTTGNQLFGQLPNRLYECHSQFEKYYPKLNKH